MTLFWEISTQRLPWNTTESVKAPTFDDATLEHLNTCGMHLFPNRGKKSVIFCPSHRKPAVTSTNVNAAEQPNTEVTSQVPRSEEYQDGEAAFKAVIDDWEEFHRLRAPVSFGPAILSVKEEKVNLKKNLDPEANPLAHANDRMDLLLLMILQLCQITPRRK